MSEEISNIVYNPLVVRDNAIDNESTEVFDACARYDVIITVVKPETEIGFPVSTWVPYCEIMCHPPLFPICHSVFYKLYDGQWRVIHW